MRRRLLLVLSAGCFGDAGEYDVPQNDPPSLEVGSIERSLSIVEIPLVVTDAQGDDVTVRVELSVPGYGVADLGAVPGLPSSPRGVALSLEWNAAEAFGSTELQPDLRFRFTPYDAQSVGEGALSNSFDFGNDPPVVLAVVVGDATVSGPASVTLSLADNSNDLVSLAAVEYSAAGDFTDAVSLPLDAANFPDSELADLPTAALGKESVVTWDPRPSVTSDAPAARLRVSIRDTWEGESEGLASYTFAVDVP
jgi:hypothetical protein